MKIALISLASLAAILGIISYFAVFSGTQVIEPVANSGNQAGSSSAPTLTLPTSSTSSAPDTSSTAFPTATTPTTSPVFATIFSAPYPVTWSEGQAQLGITGAGLQGNQLTLTLNVQLGQTAECVPINLRMVTDEEGDIAAPSYPATANFPLAPDGTCLGTAGGSYSGETVSFSIDPSITAPFLFTAGDTSSTFFEVATTTSGGVSVVVPNQSG